MIWEERHLRLDRDTDLSLRIRLELGGRYTVSHRLVVDVFFLREASELRWLRMVLDCGRWLFKIGIRIGI